MLNIIAKINLFFFEEEEISKTDAVWFYGMYAVATMIMVLTLTVFFASKSL